MNEKDQKALIRADVIMRELRGEITVTDAAAELGISRKTYYQWQKRALDGLVDGLRDKPAGRPKKDEDPEITKLKAEKEQLKEEKALLQMHLEIKEILEDLSEEDRQSILQNKEVKAERERKTRNQRKRSRKKKQSTSQTGNRQSDRQYHKKCEAVNSQLLCRMAL